MTPCRTRPSGTRVVIGAALLVAASPAGAIPPHSIPVDAGDDLPPMTMTVFSGAAPPAAPAPVQPAVPTGPQTVPVTGAGDGLPPMQMLVFDAPEPSTADDPATAALENGTITVTEGATTIGPEATTAEAARSEAEPESRLALEYAFNTGYRRDWLNFNIAGIGLDPNVLSELTWKDLDIYQLQGWVDYTDPTGVFVRAKAGGGWILDGVNIDSDFAGDNRTQEFSRSIAATDGWVFDASAGVGYHFEFSTDEKALALRLIPQAGYAYHRQRVRMTDGVLVLNRFHLLGFEVEDPFTGPFPGLNSSYATNWYGPWLGGDIGLTLFRHLDLYASASYNWVDYSADANWNLRPDFQHPISFSHKATGTGVSLFTGARYRFDSGWSLGVTFDYQNWSTDPGEDLTHFASGFTLVTQLNKVQWNSWGLNLDVRYAF